MAGGIEPQKILGIVGEVGIHLEDVVILVGYRPLESRDVCRAEPEFALSLDYVHASGVFIHFSFHNGCRAVGRSVVNDEHIHAMRQREHGVDYRRRVLGFIIGRDYNDRIGFGFHF